MDLGPRSPYPTIPASLAAATYTTDSGAVTTVPVYAQSSNSFLPLGPIGTYAEFISPNGNVIHIGLPGSNWDYASAVNDLGQAVGTSSLANGESHAFLYTGGQTFDLNNLIPLLGNWTITGAGNINDDGRILATAVTGQVDHIVILVPEAVPEPSSLAIGILFISASGLFLAWSKRSVG